MIQKTNPPKKVFCKIQKWLKKIIDYFEQIKGWARLGKKFAQDPDLAYHPRIGLPSLAKFISSNSAKIKLLL